MKSVLFYSPDLNLCASLLMFFNDKYSVTTTTDLSMVEDILHASRFDLLIIDAEPTEEVEALCEKVSGPEHHRPIILTYVFTHKYKDREAVMKKYIEAVFYKPIDLFEVAQKIDRIMQPVVRH